MSSDANLEGGTAGYMVSKKDWLAQTELGALENLRDGITKKGAPLNYVIFNNTFFAKGDPSCSVVKTRSAAVCDAIVMSRMTT